MLYYTIFYTCKHRPSSIRFGAVVTSTRYGQPSTTMRRWCKCRREEMCLGHIPRIGIILMIRAWSMGIPSAFDLHMIHRDPIPDSQAIGLEFYR